ncbi:Rne/Rng family ribonuclease, partial [Nocardioides ungokensis]
GDSDEDETSTEAEGDQDENGGEGGSSRRRRRRRRSGDDSGDGGDDPQNTVTRVRKQRSAEDEITAVAGSTRLEAKKQRRREGREAGRRRAPIVSEAEFLARRESVDRVMVIRQRDELTQIGVLEDKVLVEHYVARESQTSLIGNVYLGRVQNVLPSMEAAFIDIGKGRNAVLYAGEVNWSALGHRDGQPRKIESVLTSGQPVLVQVTKDPIGHKGARLTSQISLAGRFLVYVPDGTTSGISRKLPDTERNRLKTLLKEIVPDSAGVIVRTAAEGASEDELTRDVERLKARWEDIERKTKGSAPQLLYGEPDLTLKVVRDLFTEDFSKLVIQGQDAWDTVQGYVKHVAPDLEQRLERYDPDGSGKDVFATYRIDEQIAKGLDRKVWLPSGGSLIIDRTEAMTVVDVNTGKFTGSGGNLEETVTKNNLEAAEEIVRQLRLRDIGGIIVVDFIDMVLESNRDLVLRRLVECLGRDRTRHQVAEVTSLGLVQMTRKRIGTGLVESFSENCEHCQGRGVVIKDAPVEPKRPEDEARRGGRRTRGGRGRGDGDSGHQHDAGDGHAAKSAPSPKDIAAVAKPENADKVVTEDQQVEKQSAEPKAPAEQAPVETPPSAQPAEVSTPAEQPAAAEATQPEPVEPAAPKVVTRTRRRSASRPAGQPEHQAVPQPVVVETPAAAVETAPVAPVAPVEPPKVVTRTRGRSASRPAGPPSGAAADEGEVPAMASAPAIPSGSSGSVGEPPAHGVVEPGTAVAETGAHTDAEPSEDSHPVEHVPIKKKGSRKR